MKDVTPQGKTSRSKKLQKMLKTDAEVVRDVNIVNEDMFESLREQLARIEDNEELLEYHPLVEIARIGVNPLAPPDLALKCHETIASYIYPKVKSLEVSSKNDTNLNININVRSFSEKKDAVDPADLELEEGLEEGEAPKELNYQDFVLKKIKQDDNKDGPSYN